MPYAFGVVYVLGWECFATDFVCIVLVYPGEKGGGQLLLVMVDV